MKLCSQLLRAILNTAAVVMLSVSGVSMLRAATEWEQLNWHSDTSTKIDSGNVAQLNLAWKIATEKPVTHRPLIDNGRVYFADWSGRATAADAKTGKTIWRKAIETPNTNAAWHGFAGTGATVLAHPKAQAAGVTSAGSLTRDVYFVGSLDGQVCAYSAKDGKKLWSSPNDQASVGSSLTVAGDTLYFGGGVPKMFGRKEQGGAGVFAYSVVDRNQ